MTLGPLFINIFSDYELYHHNEVYMTIDSDSPSFKHFLLKRVCMMWFRHCFMWLMNDDNSAFRGMSLDTYF